MIALGIIFAIIFIKFKPIYQVNIAGKDIGYIEDKDDVIEKIEESLENDNETIDSITFTIKPEYELKLVNRTIDTNEEKVFEEIAKNTVVTYKYYEIALNESVISNVATIEEAEQLINEIKEQKGKEIEENNINLTVAEKFTEENIEVSPGMFLV